MKTYDLDNIFSLEEVDYNQVIIKVHGDSPLKVAQFPFISGEYAYITVTRGEDHLLKVIKNDGSSFSFHWGMGGHTLISDELEELKEQVMVFIQQNHIILNYDGGSVTSAKIYNNYNYDKWQLSLEPIGGIYWSITAQNEQDMIKEVEQLGILAKQWKYEKTSLDTWVAVNPKFSIK